MQIVIVRVIERCRSHYSCMAKLRVFCHMKDIITTVAACLTRFRFFRCVQEVRSVVRDRVYLLKRKTLGHYCL